MTPTRPDSLHDLARLSARIGQDPLLIQAAGGNTSVKDGGVMWIKASGTLLADALVRDVFVACDLPAIRTAVAAASAIADQPAEFALVKGGLRPSIETPLHAVFPQRVVVHVHCVNTLAIAIRPDADARLAERLQGFNWASVPYCKPGAALAASVVAALRPGTDVVVLHNHGLIVAADTIPEADALLTRTVAALAAQPAPFAPDMTALTARAGDGYVPMIEDNPLHGVAVHPALLAAALKGSLYPDHVVFCGIGATALEAGETPAMAVARTTLRGLPAPPFLLVPGAGALMRHDAPEPAQALMRCLGDVLLRLEPEAGVTALTDAQNAELIDWDAEKYRQALNAG